MKLRILAVGASTSVGLSAEQTAYGIRAKLFSPRTTSHLSEDGEGIGAVLIGSIPEEVEGWERMVWIALPALREACGDRSKDRTGERPPPAAAFLALPAPRPGFEDADRADLVGQIRESAFDGPIRVITGENDAFGRALALAVAHLEENPRETVLVGAAESRHHPQTYAHHDAEFRLLSLRSPDGFVPSEGAAFVELAGREVKQGEALGTLVFVAAGEEREDGQLDEAFTDLTEQAAHALGRSEKEPLPWVLLDQCGERHRTRSWSRVSTRLGDLIDSRATRVDSLADHLGDVGAASGAILLVYAAVALASGFAPARSALIALGSDGAGRATLALTGMTGQTSGGSGERPDA